MHLYRSSDRGSTTRSIQVLATAECHIARQGACWRLGDEYDRLDDSFGAIAPRPWYDVTDEILRSCLPCSCFLSLPIQGKILRMRLD